MMLSESTKIFSGGLTLIITLIAITPVCGFLFQCGCDWPWSGLDGRCNFHLPDAVYKCPWCESMTAGILSTLAAVIGGIYASFATNPMSCDSKSVAVMLRVLAGLGMFLLLATLFALIAASVQDYPLEIGGKWGIAPLETG